MHKEQIIEGDKLIVKFMGCTMKNNIVICNEDIKTSNENALNCYNISHARYSISYDWLIPVVLKLRMLINNLEYTDDEAYNEEIEEFRACYSYVYGIDEDTLNNSVYRYN